MSAAADAPAGKLLEAAVAEHVEWLRVHHYSTSEVRDRGYSLRRFVRWCSERGVESIGEVTRPVAERYQRHLYYRHKPNGQALSLSRQQSLLIAVQGLFRWLVRQHQLEVDPTAELELPRRGRHLPMAVLTIADVERVLAQPDVGTALGLRDRAMLEMLYSTGLRRKELLGLKLYDIDRQRGVVLVREGKGGKDRVVPVGERALAWVDRYLEDVRPLWVKDGVELHVFLQHTSRPMTPWWLTELTSRYVRAAGVGKRGACHLFRHSMATLMLEGGADVRYIQALLGHERLTTTEIYTHVSIEKLRSVHASTHPGAWLKRSVETTEDGSSGAGQAR